MARKRRRAADDFEVLPRDGHFELVGPDGGAIELRLHTKSREREPACRDRVELELQARDAGKGRWNKLAYIYARDSYEDELRYVLEDRRVWAPAVKKAMSTLGTAAPPQRVLAAVVERCDDADAAEPLALLVDAWDRAYRG